MAIAASKAYCGAEGTQNFCVWVMEVVPLVLIVAIGHDFCGKSLENSNGYWERYSLNTKVTWKCLYAQLNCWQKGRI